MVQIIGTKKSSDTRKAERFFKERGVSFHFVDLTERALSPGELENITRTVDPEDLIDPESKLYKKKGMAYMDFDILEELLETPTLMKMPVVRWNKEAAVGVQEGVWKEWIEKEKEQS
jgi:arsenate reductase-like glutaredoxin family protein